MTRLPGPSITVHKLDALGRTVVSYSGRVLARTGSQVILEAFFDRGPVAVGPVTFNPGDRFVEHYDAGRWYNIFEVYDANDGRFKCWYCNITRPARITGGSVASDDLALDLLIEPEGQAILLDRDEFDALALDQNERESALAALRELQNLAQTGKLPRWMTKGDWRTPEERNP